MLDGLMHLFARRPWLEIGVDILDIFIVTWVVYRVLLVLRGTRAMQMGTGLGIIFAIYVVAKWVHLVTLFNLLSTLLSSVILVVVVVFQNDIRRGLMRVGLQSFLGASRLQESKVIDEIVSAVTELARHRIGALICFEQTANLDEFVASAGTPLDASVQRDLLVTLFIPEGVNRLHDGAVIIRNLRIATAGAFFPMPDTRLADRSFGTRHRAALGVTEETDAVVVVVSEERGTISLCFGGNIIPNLDGASLRQALLGLFGENAKRKKQAAKREGREARDTREGTEPKKRSVSSHNHAPASQRMPSMRPPHPSEFTPAPSSVIPAAPESELGLGLNEAPVTQPMQSTRMELETRPDENE